MIKQAGVPEGFCDDGVRAILDRPVDRDGQPTVSVLHVLTRIAGGGAEDNTLHTINGLDHSRYRIDLAVGGPSERASIEKTGLHPAVRLLAIPHLQRNPAPAAEVAALRELRAIIRSGGYRIVHTHGSKAGILGRMAARREGVPVIVHGVHGISFHPSMGALQRRLFRYLERRTGRYTTAFVCVGEEMRRQYLEAGIGSPERYTIIHSGMELQRFREAAATRNTIAREVRSELGIPADALIVGTVSRHEPRKGYDHLIAAAAGLLSVPGATTTTDLSEELRERLWFLSVGDGPEGERLRRLVVEAEIRERFVFTGYRNDVERMLAAMDVATLTSRWEGLPRMLVQAAAAGTPTVSFEVDGVREIVTDGETGFIVAPGDRQTLAERIGRLLADEGLRRELGAAARRNVNDSWTIESMVNSTDTLYRSLL